MTNDRYLIGSYFACAILSAALGTGAYLFLGRAFNALADAASIRRFAVILKRVFPAGLLFAALLGFVSVSYQGCNRSTYESIVQSRGYLVEKSQEQISSASLYILVAVLIWNLVSVLVLKSVKSIRKDNQ